MWASFSNNWNTNSGARNRPDIIVNYFHTHTAAVVAKKIAGFKSKIQMEPDGDIACTKPGAAASSVVTAVERALSPRLRAKQRWDMAGLKDRMLRVG
jgi:hypothetical protein